MVLGVVYGGLRWLAVFRYVLLIISTVVHFKPIIVLKMALKNEAAKSKTRM